MWWYSMSAHLITPVFSSDTCLASSLCLCQQQIVRNLIICASSIVHVREQPSGSHRMNYMVQMRGNGNEAKPSFTF